MLKQCPHCKKELTNIIESYDRKGTKYIKKYLCPHCRKSLKLK